MRYEGTVYRPPSEAGSLLIQATIGCPHNKCTFCNLYKRKKFRIRPIHEIKEDLLKAQETYGNQVQSVFFPDGNTIILRTKDLVEILAYTRTLFPDLERITLYGSARFLLLKSLADFQALRNAGLTRIHSGMESGSDIVLNKIQKGSTSEQIIEGGLRVKQAGIELSEYILLGIGGTELSTEHALESAKVLNAFDPHFIRLRTYSPVPHTPLGQEYLQGTFALPGAHGIIRETRLLVENLQTTGLLLSDHISNHVHLNGKLPEDKAALLQLLDHALTIEETEFPEYDYRFL